jgi:hypothetical protein
MQSHLLESLGLLLILGQFLEILNAKILSKLDTLFCVGFEIEL